MEHITDSSNITKLESLYKKIAEGNVILFLGAGASVTNKKYLSQQLIDYYEAKVSINSGIENITEFVDALSADSNFSRSKFDLFVTELLRNLAVQDMHKTIASIPWRQIITTNYDLLIERANEEVLKTNSDAKEIIPIRSIKEYYRLCSSQQIQYIKLNGCISDKSAYPLAFSTKDFENANSFYKTILNQLKEPSPNIEFLFIGYSFSDAFAQQFFAKFDIGREKRWIYNVDPYVNDLKLPYYLDKKIAIIKSTSADFFKSYGEWIEKNAEFKNKLLNLNKIKDSKNNPISISPQLRQKFHNVLEQLNSESKDYIKAQDFYLGVEPNYNVIRKNYDVIKKDKIEEAKKFILDKVNSNDSNLIPLFFLEGSFGTGKTTFTYRLIHELTNNTDSLDAVAFEIKDFENFKIKDFCVLVQKINCKYIILHSNYTEHSDIYKSLLQLRAELSSKQEDVCFLFIQSIRENIFSSYNKSLPQKNIYSIKIDSAFTIEETTDFVEKLGESNLVHWRDAKEKNQIIQTINKTYKGDSFISLLGLIENGKHVDDLKEAYSQLSSDCKKAFIFTALTHRYNIFMPASLLKDLISMNWDDFMSNVVQSEGKGILMQESIDANGLDPDLYFRTKHSLIADKLATEVIFDKQKRYEHYKSLFTKIHSSDKYCKLAINILKSLEQNKEFSAEQINKLYDLSYNNLSDNPYFILRYAINLQYRGTKKDIEKAIEYLIYAESLLEKKNHKFIHRRAVLNAKLAELWFKEEKELNKTLTYLHEAKELYYAKQTYDPCSHYSYYDLLVLLLWELKCMQLDIDEQLRLQIEIEEQFETANKSITDGIDRIARLEVLYREIQKKSFDEKTDYLSSLLELYEDEHLRPYACILLYNYYYQSNNIEKSDELIDELENYLDCNEVVRFLFKFYGNNLNYVNYRMKFFDLTKRVDFIQNSLMYNYYMFIAESYNTNFYHGRTYLNNIESKYHYLNPEYQQEWKESDSENPKIFEGIIKKNDKGFYLFKSKELQTPFRMKNQSKLKEGTEVKAKLVFLLNGISAVII